MDAGIELLTCTQSRGAIASLLDWISKQQDPELLSVARKNA